VEKQEKKKKDRICKEKYLEAHKLFATPKVKIFTSSASSAASKIIAALESRNPQFVVRTQNKKPKWW
jgi:hypothetical protein